MATLTGTLQRDGCVIRYVETSGRAPAIVFTHGAAADHHMFDAQLEALANDGRKVVVWDLRAHGQSRPNTVPFTSERALEDLVALIEHLKLDRPVLAGQSFGGNLSQAAVKRWPDRFRALVVMDSTWNAGPLSSFERSMLGLAAPMMSLIPARSLPRMLANASATTEFGRADALRAFSQLSKREFLEVWSAAVSLVEPDPDYRTPIPLCLIRGARDLTGNIRSAMPKWAEAERIREHVVPNAGHIVTQDAPDAVTEILRAFLAELDRS